MKLRIVADVTTIWVLTTVKNKLHPLFRFWLLIIPFFISAALFLSGFFAIFSPLPILLLGVGSGFSFALLAAAVNSAIIYFTSGPTVFQFYWLFVGSAGVFIPFFLVKRRLGLEKTTAYAWFCQVLVIAALLWGYSLWRGHGFIEEAKIIVGGFSDFILNSLTPDTRQKLLGELSEADWRHNTLVEMPSLVATLALVLIWVNLYLLISLNPKRILAKMGITRKTFYQWKTNEWLIWPTLACWALVLQSEPIISDLALGFFKLLMAVYAIQGLAIMSTAFDAWRIKGFFRAMAYMAVFFLMVPLLLGVGFFDQWFDFRAKFRQS